MTLLTAHKILIASAIACFGLYTVWALRQYSMTSDMTTLSGAGAGAAAAVGFGIYLRTVWRRGSL